MIRAPRDVKTAKVEMNRETRVTQEHLPTTPQRKIPCSPTLVTKIMGSTWDVIRKPGHIPEDPVAPGPI